jgi:hypothetical protein
MRKRTLLGTLSGLGAGTLTLLADSNWLLAGVVGVGLGAIVFIFIHAYPNDIAPPADRRHENTVRRRSAQQR